MSRIVRAACAALVLLAAASPASAAKKDDPLAGTTEQRGLLPVRVDKVKGRILLELPAPDADIPRPDVPGPDGTDVPDLAGRQRSVRGPERTAARPVTQASVTSKSV